MFTKFTTKAQAEKHRYNAWAGNQNGIAYDPKCCAATVHEGGRGGMMYQCGKPNGHGPDGLYCATHNPEAVQKRRDKQQEKWDAKQRAERPKWYANNMFSLLKESRDGITVAWQRKRDELLQNIEK